VSVLLEVTEKVLLGILYLFLGFMAWVACCALPSFLLFLVSLPFQAWASGSDEKSEATIWWVVGGGGVFIGTVAFLWIGISYLNERRNTALLAQFRREEIENVSGDAPPARQIPAEQSRHEEI
jgi:hypothetical protein